MTVGSLIGGQKNIASLDVTGESLTQNIRNIYQKAVDLVTDSDGVYAKRFEYDGICFEPYELAIEALRVEPLPPTLARRVRGIRVTINDGEYFDGQGLVLSPLNHDGKWRYAARQIQNIDGVYVNQRLDTSNLLDFILYVEQKLTAAEIENDIEEASWNI